MDPLSQGSFFSFYHYKNSILYSHILGWKRNGKNRGNLSAGSAITIVFFFLVAFWFLIQLLTRTSRPIILNNDVCPVQKGGVRRFPFDTDKKHDPEKAGVHKGSNGLYFGLDIEPKLRNQAAVRYAGFTAPVTHG